MKNLKKYEEFVTEGYGDYEEGDDEYTRQQKDYEWQKRNVQRDERPTPDIRTQPENRQSDNSEVEEAEEYINDLMDQGMSMEMI